MANLGSDGKSVHATTTGGAEDTITLSAPWSHVEILSRDGASEVFYRVDSDDSIEAANEAGTEVIPASSGGQVIRTKGNSEVVVRLWTESPTKVSVIGR